MLKPPSCFKNVESPTRLDHISTNHPKSFHLSSVYETGLPEFHKWTLTNSHEIYKSFDDGFVLRGVFLDILHAFDKVWHKGIIIKLKQNGISGKLLSALSDFLKDRKHRVILNGQVSS